MLTIICCKCRQSYAANVDNYIPPNSLEISNSKDWVSANALQERWSGWLLPLVLLSVSRGSQCMAGEMVRLVATAGCGLSGQRLSIHGKRDCQVGCYHWLCSQWARTVFPHAKFLKHLKILIEAHTGKRQLVACMAMH